MTKLTYNVIGGNHEVYTGIKTYPDACVTASHTRGRIVAVYEPCEIKDVVRVRTDRLLARI